MQTKHYRRGMKFKCESQGSSALGGTPWILVLHCLKQQYTLSLSLTDSMKHYFSFGTKSIAPASRLALLLGQTIPAWGLTPQTYAEAPAPGLARPKSSSVLSLFPQPSH